MVKREHDQPSSGGHSWASASVPDRTPSTLSDAHREMAQRADEARSRASEGNSSASSGGNSGGGNQGGGHGGEREHDHSHHDHGHHDHHHHDHHSGGSGHNNPCEHNMRDRDHSTCGGGGGGGSRDSGKDCNVM